MTNNANEPAFPVVMPGDEKKGWEAVCIPGLTKREYFAAMAMQSIISGPNFNGNSEQDVAILSTRHADALLLELGKTVQ